MAKRHGVVPSPGLKKKRRVRTFANALDTFEPLPHKAPTAGHEMLAPLRAGEDANRIRCDVTGDFLERKAVSDAEGEPVMRFYDMTRHMRTLSYTPLDWPAQASESINTTPCSQQRGKPDKPAWRPPAKSKRIPATRPSAGLREACYCAGGSSVNRSALASSA